MSDDLAMRLRAAARDLWEVGLKEDADLMVEAAEALAEHERKPVKDRLDLASQ